MLVDIKLSDDDCLFIDNDFALVEENICIQQDITSQLKSSLKSLFYDSGYGSSFLSFIHATIDDHMLVVIRQTVSSVLEQHPNIISNTVSVNISSIEPVIIDMEFQSVFSSERVSFSYTQNNEL